MRVAEGIAVLLVALLAWGCRGAEIPSGERFGAELTLAEPTSLAGVLSEPERFADAPILLRGHLADVCQRKGCWTVLQDGDAQIRVRFENYAFFLPRDAVGAEAFVQGRIDVQTLSEAEARHYASESLREDPDAVSGPQREVGLIASGVRLLRSD